MQWKASQAQLIDGGHSIPQLRQTNNSSAPTYKILTLQKLVHHRVFNWLSSCIVLSEIVNRYTQPCLREEVQPGLGTSNWLHLARTRASLQPDPSLSPRGCWVAYVGFLILKKLSSESIQVYLCGCGVSQAHLIRGDFPGCLWTLMKGHPNLAKTAGTKKELLPVITEILLMMRGNLELRLPHGLLQAPSESTKKLFMCPLKFDKTLILITSDSPITPDDQTEAPKRVRELQCWWNCSIV